MSGQLSGAGDRVRTGDIQLGRLTLYQLSYSRGCEASRTRSSLKPSQWRMVGSNHRRHKPADLQSAPFDHSGNPPNIGFSIELRPRAGDGTRTYNRLFTKQVLYQLSYASQSEVASLLLPPRTRAEAPP